MQFGGIDFARVSLSSLSAFNPKLNVLQMPYLYTGAEHMWQVLEGPIAEEKARFREAMMPIYGKYCSEYMDIVESILKAGR